MQRRVVSWQQRWKTSWRVKLMQVERLTSLDQLRQIAPAWSPLTEDVPFRDVGWLLSWWQHFGAGKELFVLAVRNADRRVVGIAPWYLEATHSRGRIVRFLGSGQVCSDYLSVLAEPKCEEDVAAAVARWLATQRDSGDAGRRANRWDLLELNGVAAGDRAVDALVRRLRWEGCLVHQRPAMQCWRIPLPASWDDYVAGLSKSHRKQVRRVERRLIDSGRAALHRVTHLDALPRGMAVLVDLHQRRRKWLGQPGCFSCPQFSGFLHDAAAAMLATRQIELHWVELDGRPVAAELNLLGGGITYAYQSGVDPDCLDDEPGRLSTILTLKQALADRQRAYDLLRGDEAYKAHWRAEPQPQTELHVVPRHPAARLRHSVWLAGDAMKHWVKSGLQRER